MKPSEWLDVRSPWTAADGAAANQLGAKFRQHGLSLLAEAFERTSAQEQVLFLHEAATYYRERSADVGDWWIYWLSSILLWGSWTLVVIVAATLYLPLFAIISGLTSGLF